MSGTDDDIDGILALFQLYEQKMYYITYAILHDSHLDGNAGAHEDQRDRKNDQAADEGLDDADKHFCKGNRMRGYGRKQAVLNLALVVKIHGDRNGCHVNAGDQHGHADHAAEHMRRKTLRQDADGRK